MNGSMVLVSRIAHTVTVSALLVLYAVVVISVLADLF
jgi:hypothetical protein